MRGGSNGYDADAGPSLLRDRPPCSSVSGHESRHALGARLAALAWLAPQYDYVQETMQRLPDTWHRRLTEV
jgi:hypothetical protein